MKVYEAVIYRNGSTVVRAKCEGMCVRRDAPATTLTIRAPYVFATRPSDKLAVTSCSPSCRVVKSELVKRHVTREALIETLSPEIRDLYATLKLKLREHATQCNQLQCLESRKEALEKLADNMADPRAIVSAMGFMKRPFRYGPGPWMRGPGPCMRGRGGPWMRGRGGPGMRGRGGPGVNGRCARGPGREGRGRQGRGRQFQGAPVFDRTVDNAMVLEEEDCGPEEPLDQRLNPVTAVGNDTAIDQEVASDDSSSFSEELAELAWGDGDGNGDDESQEDGEGEDGAKGTAEATETAETSGRKGGEGCRRKGGEERWRKGRRGVVGVVCRVMTQAAEEVSRLDLELIDLHTQADFLKDEIVTLSYQLDQELGLMVRQPLARQKPMATDALQQLMARVEVPRCEVMHDIQAIVEPVQRRQDAAMESALGADSAPGADSALGAETGAETGVERGAERGAEAGADDLIVDLDLEFLLGNSSWHPVYDFKFVGDNLETCKVDYYAEVVQHTRLDLLGDVSVYLSSGGVNEKPSPDPQEKLFVDIKEPVRRVPMPRPMARMLVAEVAEEQDGKERSHRARRAAHSGSDHFGNQRVLLAEGTVVKSKGGPQRLCLASFELPSRIYHQVFANNPTAAYRAFYITNQSEFTLMNHATANVFIASQFIGASRLHDYCLPDAEVCLYGGIDEAVNVKCLTDGNETYNSTTGNLLVGNGKKETRSTKLHIHNTHEDVDINLIISYPFPSVKNEAIKVTVQDLTITKNLQTCTYHTDVLAAHKNQQTKFLHNETTGSVIEHRELKKKDEFDTVGLVYAIEYPKDQEITITF
ncbi:hypothetical protein GNI_059020 [Gregarina niphandrodes]|uniref:DUF4139 domain-containing protein n=1 Tax=Gregarina niphandrodes TaxID=110365 RepID=A0A023B8J3_GRENI|nr:hypothetical protein GNI_059020 [Gregarina niphandrodes]EZG69241.1 hypothetical protein GNI_059020 [Gregarina niphandrodes]|eukprot:XP_011134456.1 hypothetical protein GNI_059020 [Gregarina niphandrodes]